MEVGFFCMVAGKWEEGQEEEEGVVVVVAEE